MLDYIYRHADKIISIPINARLLFYMYNDEYIDKSDKYLLQVKLELSETYTYPDIWNFTVYPWKPTVVSACRQTVLSHWQYM